MDQTLFFMIKQSYKIFKTTKVFCIGASASCTTVHSTFTNTYELSSFIIIAFHNLTYNITISNKMFCVPTVLVLKHKSLSPERTTHHFHSTGVPPLSGTGCHR